MKKKVKEASKNKKFDFGKGVILDLQMSVTLSIPNKGGSDHYFGLKPRISGIDAAPDKKSVIEALGEMSDALDTFIVPKLTRIIRKVKEGQDE
jgi:hypothetical protein